jgi:hypothetical protein
MDMTIETSAQIYKLALAVLALAGGALLFRYQYDPVGAEAEYWRFDRWTGRVVVCGTMSGRSECVAVVRP